MVSAGTIWSYQTISPKFLWQPQKKSIAKVSVAFGWNRRWKVGLRRMPPQLIYLAVGYFWLACCRPFDQWF